MSSSLTYIVHGDLLASPAHTLVNTVNCMGVMGAGLAKQFKAQYPLCYEPRYTHLCATHAFKPGTFQIVREYLPTHLILNASTKDHWRQDARIAWVESILVRIERDFTLLDMRSLAISKLGCGNGGLQWSDVGPLMVHYLKCIDAPISIYVNAGDVQYS